MELVHELIPLPCFDSNLPWGCGRARTVSRPRHLGLAKGCELSRSIRCHRAGAPTSRLISSIKCDPLCGRRMILKKLWRDFFSDPSQWWDHRADKVNPRYPDFKHKMKQSALWLVDDSNPPWVEAELAAMAPGRLQSNIFSWNVNLQKHVKAGEYKKAIELFQQLEQEGMDPDKFTFVPIVNACARLRVLEEGRRIHAQIIQHGHESDVYVASCLVNMYAKCGSIEDAWRVFNKMPSRDVVSWNVMILGYVKSGEGQKALELFRQMFVEDVEPSNITFVGLLNACASLAALEDGRLVHEQIIRRGYESEVFVGNSLVDMYAKCGSIVDARRVFDNMSSRNVISWNAMILGYVKCGEGQKALELCRQMNSQGVEGNNITFVGVLNACGSLGALETGRRVHEDIRRKGYEFDVFVASSLVDMYAKCGSIEFALRVFNKMPSHDVVSWNAMILGYVKCGQGQKALELSRRMYVAGVEPNHVTFAGVLNACASVAALEAGKIVHENVIRSGYESDVFVVTSLVDMYAKCGSIECAKRTFDTMTARNVVSWTAMLAGYAMHGRAKEAVEHFERMCQEGVEVNDVTFLCLLSACSHGALSEECLYYFRSMSDIYNISPTVGHYSCVIDLLGRVGHLQKAEDLIRSMPFGPDATVWMSLLGACKIHGDVEMGERAAKQVLALEPENVSAYVLLSNIYAGAGMWNRVQAVHCEKLERNVCTKPKRTWIEVNKNVHSFLVNDSSHLQIAEIHAELEKLSLEISEAGYVPHIIFVGPEFPTGAIPNLLDIRFTVHSAYGEQQGFHLSPY